MIFGILAAAACLSTLWADRDERGPAFASGLVILLGWALFNLTWTDYAPDLLLAEMGIRSNYVDIWSITDMVAGAAILFFGMTRWWALAVYALLLTQVFFHCVYRFYEIDFAAYSMILDGLFLGQVAVIFLIGGGKCGDYLLDLFNNARDVFRSPQAASRKEAK